MSYVGAGQVSPTQSAERLKPKVSGIIGETLTEIQAQLGALETVLGSHEQSIDVVLSSKQPADTPDLPPRPTTTAMHQVLVNIADRINKQRQYVESLTSRVAL